MKETKYSYRIINREKTSHSFLKAKEKRG